MRASGEKVSPYKIISVYGYGYFIYIIASVILVIPNNIVQIIMLIYAAVTSTLQLTINILREMHKETSTKILVTV